MNTTAPMIPLFDIRLTDGDLDAVADVLRSGGLGTGTAVTAFEEAFAAHLGVAHAVAVSTCTAALHLAYLAAGVGPGDEVIVTGMTFAATAAAVIYCGATPVFADIVGPHDPSIDPESVRPCITPRTKAIGAVHFAGYAAPIRELRALCDEHGLALVEDTAHAPSASAPDADGVSRKLGTFGMAGCFSFFSNKVLSCGEGGLLATDDARVAEVARTQRDAAHFNYLLDDPRAALLHSRFGRLADDIACRRDRTLRYRERLAGVDGLSLPYTDEAVAQSSCYVMPVVVEDAERRDGIRLALREDHGVQTSLLYPSVHEFTAYRERFPGISLPRTERFSRTEVTLPLFGHLSDGEQDRVVEALVAELGA